MDQSLPQVNLYRLLSEDVRQRIHGLSLQSVTSLHESQTALQHDINEFIRSKLSEFVAAVESHVAEGSKPSVDKSSNTAQIAGADSAGRPEDAPTGVGADAPDADTKHLADSDSPSAAATPSSKPASPTPKSILIVPSRSRRKNHRVSSSSSDNVPAKKVAFDEERNTIVVFDEEYNVESASDDEAAIPTNPIEIEASNMSSSSILTSPTQLIEDTRESSSDFTFEKLSESEPLETGIQDDHDDLEFAFDEVMDSEYYEEEMKRYDERTRKEGEESQGELQGSESLWYPRDKALADEHDVSKHHSDDASATEAAAPPPVVGSLPIEIGNGILSGSWTNVNHSGSIVIGDVALDEDDDPNGVGDDIDPLHMSFSQRMSQETRR